jgi:hypothetical protein
MNRYKCIVTDVQATAAAAAHPDGAYVKWTDHVAEVERLKERLAEVEDEVSALRCLLADEGYQVGTYVGQRIIPLFSRPSDNAARAGEGEGHASDCAVHNAPALPVGPCNCGRKP